MDTWVKNAGGGAYLNDDQLKYIQGQFQKAPEYSQYTGQRPTVAMGDFIGGATLGTTLANDAALKPAEQTGTTSGGATSFLTPEMQDLVRAKLMDQLNTPLPTMDSPGLAPAISAFSQAQNKATARQVNQNAEAFGASGLEASGARLSADRGAIEQQGLNEATFGSNLMMGELNAQRQQVQTALQQALALNDQDVSRQLQERLANLNATIQRESLAQTGRLGQADIDLRRAGQTGNLNLGLLNLIQNGRQFNDSLGFNIANAEAMLNNNAVRMLLGI